MQEIIRGIVIGLKLAGLSHSVVVAKLNENHLGGSLGFVSKVWNKWNSGQCLQNPYHNSGRKSIPINESVILKTIAKRPRITAKELQADPKINPWNVSYPTMKRKLNAMDIKAKKVVKTFSISPKNIGERLTWCRKFRQWDQKTWEQVWFSDEAKLFSKKSGHAYFWKLPGYHKKSEKEENSMYHNGMEILVWGYITSDGVGRLIKIQETLNGENYLSVLKVNLPVHIMKSQGIIWQQDNAPCHRVSLTWMAEKNIEVLPWPAQSPDLNPIEHVWARIKHELWLKRDKIRSKDDVWEFTKKIWYGTKVERMIPRLYENYRERIRQIIRFKGGQSTH